MKLESIGRSERTGDQLWRVLETVRVKIAPRMYVQVPAGYVSNLGTIPRPARWFVSPSEGGFADLFLLHDWLCNEDHQDDGTELDSGVSRFLADAILYDLMVKRNLPVYKRYVIWIACRLYARSRGLV